MTPQQSTADVSVVGLGRVGLPLALSFAERGLHVVGIDNDPARLGAVRDGRMPFEETGAQELLDRIRAAPPDFFERLIVNLLLSMGYGGSAADAAKELVRRLRDEARAL